MKSTADVVECTEVDYATGSFCSSWSIPPLTVGGLRSDGKGCAMCIYDDNCGGWFGFSLGCFLLILHHIASDIRKGKKQMKQMGITEGICGNTCYLNMTLGYLQSVPPIRNSNSQCADGIPPRQNRWLLETLQKPARWDHPTGPPTARTMGKLVSFFFFLWFSASFCFFSLFKIGSPLVL